MANRKAELQKGKEIAEKVIKNSEQKARQRKKRLVPLEKVGTHKDKLVPIQSVHESDRDYEQRVISERKSRLQPIRNVGEDDASYAARVKADKEQSKSEHQKLRKAALKGFDSAW